MVGKVAQPMLATFVSTYRYSSVVPFLCRKVVHTLLVALPPLGHFYDLLRKTLISFFYLFDRIFHGSQFGLAVRILPHLVQRLCLSASQPPVPGERIKKPH